MKRAPAMEKSIKDIKAGDFRVKVLGIVVDKDSGNSSAIIDDGTGRALAFFPDLGSFGGVNVGKPIRVMGKVKHGDIPEIEVEVMQEMSKLDMDLYERVRNISEKLWGTV